MIVGKGGNHAERLERIFAEKAAGVFAVERGLTRHLEASLPEALPREVQELIPRRSSPIGVFPQQHNFGLVNSSFSKMLQSQDKIPNAFALFHTAEIHDLPNLRRS